MSVTVPPSTHTWADAVAAGFYGERTDPLPDEVYNTDQEDIPWALTSVTPATQAVAKTGAWTVAAVGTFPTTDPQALTLDLETALEGRVWHSLDVTELTLDGFTAHYLEAPQEPAAIGTGAAVVKYAGVEHGRIPFDWT